MATRLPVLSPYLEGFWNQALAEKGWNAKHLAEAAGVSYGYTRRIVNGTLIPSRDALRRLCKAAGQDFGAVWRGLHSDQVAMDATPDDLAPRAAKFFSHVRKMISESTDAETDELFKAHGLTPQSVNTKEEAMADAVRQKVIELMNTLPLEGVGELLLRARELFQEYNQSSQEHRIQA